GARGARARRSGAHAVGGLVRHLRHAARGRDRGPLDPHAAHRPHGEDARALGEFMSASSVAPIAASRGITIGLSGSSRRSLDALAKLVRSAGTWDTLVLSEHANLELLDGLVADHEACTRYR